MTVSWCGFCVKEIDAVDTVQGLQGGILSSFYLVLTYCWGCISCYLFLAAACKRIAWWNAGLLQSGGMHLRTCVSQDAPVLLQNDRSCKAFPRSWTWMVLPTACQVLQVWEENLVTGENSFIEASLYLPLEEICGLMSTSVMYGCPFWWIVSRAWRQSIFLSQKFLSASKKVVGTFASGKVGLHWTGGIPVHYFGCL